MANIFKLLKPYKGAIPLPGFPAIEPGEVPAASVLLFYRSNPGITEKVESRMYKCPWYPPPFHAAVTVGGGLFLNVGKFREMQTIEGEFRSTRRVDVLLYYMADPLRNAIKKAAFENVDKPKVGFQFPTYSILEFINFGLRWFPSQNAEICSEDCVELMAQGHVTCSYNKPNRTTPADLLNYGMENQVGVIMKTVWIGSDFK